MASWLTLSGSNYPHLEEISIVPTMFEPLRFDCGREDIKEESQSASLIKKKKQVYKYKIFLRV